MCDGVGGLAVEVARGAIGVEKIPAGEDFVAVGPGGKGVRGPRGRGARLQRPRLVAGVVRIVPAKREADPVADVELAQRVSGCIRLVVDLDELEVGVADETCINLILRRLRRVVHHLVYHEVFEVRSTITQSDEGGPQQREVRSAGALGVCADRDAVRRAAEVDVLAIPAGHSGGVRREVHVIAVFAQREGPTEVGNLVENKVFFGWDWRECGDLVLGEHLDAEFVGLLVAEPPPAHVDGRTAHVAKFDHIATGAVSVGEHLVDDNGPGIHETVGVSGRTARCGTGAPAVGLVPEVQAAFRIADRQRKTFAVGVVVPAVAVAEVQNVLSDDGRGEFEILSGVGKPRAADEPRAVLTGNRNAIAGYVIPLVERGQVAYHDDVLARVDGHRAEGEVDSVAEPQTRKRQRVGRDVRDLDVLEVAGVGVSRVDLVLRGSGGVIHDLGNADVRRDVDVVSSIVQRAPHAVVVDPRLDVPALVEGDRAGVEGSPRLRVRAVECVVDRACRRVDGQFASQVDDPPVQVRTVDIERRRDDVRVETDILVLLQHAGTQTRGHTRSGRKKRAAEPTDSRDPLAVAHICPGEVVVAVAPTRRLAHDRVMDFRFNLVEPGEIGFESQRTVVEQESVKAVGKIGYKLRRVAQFLVETPRGPTERVDIIAVDIPQTEFRVPTVESPFSVALTIVGRPPVVMRPIPVVRVMIDNEVVAEGGDIKQLPDRRIIGGRIVGQGMQQVPGRGIPFVEATLGVDVVIFLLASEVTGGERIVGPFHGVVQSPVQTVDVKVDEVTVSGKAPGGQLAIGRPAILQIRCTTTAVRPDVVETRPEGECVERVHRVVAEHGEVELLGPVLALERESEGVLFVAAAAAGAADDAHSGVYLEPGRAVGVDPLDGGGAFPIDPAPSRIGVDTIRAEHIVQGSHDRQSRDRPQVVHDRSTVRWVVDDVRIHFVVGKHATPVIGETSGSSRLMDYVLEEDVGVRIGVGGVVAGLDGHGTHDRRRGNRNGGGVQRRVGVDVPGVVQERIRAVGRVVNLRARGVRADCQVERVGVEAPVVIERGVFHVTPP